MMAIMLRLEISLWLQRVSSLDSEIDYETIPTVVKSTEEKPSLRSKRSKRAILGDAEESSEPKVQSI